MQKRNIGGRAFIVFALGAASHYAVMFNRVAAGQMFPQLMAEFNTTGVGVAALSSIYYYTYSIMQVPAGALADTLGPRKLLSSGLLIGGLAWLLFASARTLTIASIARLIAGFGLAGIFLGLLKSIELWFPAKKYGTLTGISTFFGNLGVATAMFPFVILVNAIGWRTSSYVVGGLTVTLAALVWLFVRDEGPNYREGLKKPGLVSILKTSFYGLVEVLKNKGSLPPFFGFMLIFGGLMTFTGLWGVPFMMQVHGIAQSVAGSLMMLTTAGGALAAVFVGWLTDRSGRPKLMFCLLAGMQALAWLIILWTIGRPGEEISTVALCVAMVSMGVSNSSFLPAFVIMRKANRPEMSSLAQGLNNASGFIGAIAMQAAVSAIMDYGWGGGYFTEGVRFYSAAAYRGGFTACLAAVALAIVSGLLMTRDARG